MKRVQGIKTKVKWFTAVSCLMPMALLPGITAGCSSTDFQRLQWLCNDYQLPVEGYVIEGWFQIIHVPGMERFLQEHLQIDRGYHQVTLNDGSVVSTNMQRKDDKWQIELQMISRHSVSAAQYYNRWQRFADQYCHNNPVGITVIAQLPESLDASVSTKLIKELADGLEVQIVSEIATEQYTQHSGYSRQLMHKIQVNGERINSSITVVPKETITYMYIASPFLYQQI